MPYLNLPPDSETQGKMERCVAAVQAEGYDEKAAIAICYTSLTGRRRKEKYDDIDFSPPQGVIDAAKRGLELRRQFGRGGTAVGLARARTLSNGTTISPTTAKRMASFFARHAIDRRADWADPAKPTNGYIAHMLWGGDDGMAWASKLVRQMKARETQTLKADGTTVLPTGTTGEYTGAIAALWVDRELGSILAIPETNDLGLDALSPDELHITLCALGDTADPAIAAAKNAIIVAMAQSAILLPPITVKVGGLGQFFPQDAGAQSALYASIDSPELLKWRSVLADMLSSQGVNLDDYTHGFTPHVTLGYAKAPTDLGDIPITPTEIPFTHLTLAWAGELVHFPLLGGGVTTKAESDDSGSKRRSGSHSDSSGSKKRSESSSSSSSSSKRSGYNWGAKAGQVIRGRLARGADGRFTSTGSSPAQKPKKATSARGGKTGAKPPERKGRKTGVGSRGGKTLAQQAAERMIREQKRQADRAKREAERQADRAKRDTEREAAKKKREEERAAREAKRNEGKGGKGSSGGKGGDDKKAEAAKKKAIYKAIDNYGEGNKLSKDEESLLLEEGLVIRGPDGKLILTPKGRQVMAEEAADDKKKELGVAFKAFMRNVGGGVKRDELKDSDFVLSNERKFPVVIPKDVKDAVSSWGRYKGKTSFETFKRNLIALAKRKGEKFVAALPESWSVKEASAQFLSFKQADGTYRWVLFSSNAYRDRDREIVSRKALADDVAYMDTTGDYGPLRWWHMPGIELGTCDFNAIFGNILVESGTFLGPAVAKAVAERAKDFQASIGFRHPPDEPDQDGVFHTIRRFERSLLPAGRAANTLTALAVHYKAGAMMDPEVILKKTQALQDMLGPEGAKEVLDSAQRIEVKAAEEGIAYKAKADDMEETPEVKAEEDQAAEDDAGMTGDTETSEDTADMADDEEVYVADMTLTEFGEMMAAALADALQPVLDALDIETKMAAHSDKITAGLQELKGMYSSRKEVSDESLAAQARAAQQLTKLETKIKELEASHAAQLQAILADFEATKALAHELAAETPPAAKGYRASTANDTVTDQNHRLKGAMPTDDDDMIAKFLRPMAPQMPR